MFRINSLTNKPSFHSCDNKGDGYVKLVLDEQGWEEFNDEVGFFNPNLLSRYFKKLVNESLSDADMPEGLAIQRASQERFHETLWSAFSEELLGNSGGQENPSGVMYSETHGPATTLYVNWQGGDSYMYLIAAVDLTLTLDYPISKLPVQLAKLPPQIDVILEKCGFHVVPAGFDSWRISFSMAEKDILSSSPDGFKACYRVLKVLRDDISQKLGWDSSLLPSYMFKTVLLSQLFLTGHSWQKDVCSQRIRHILELVLEGVTQEEIRSFFILGHNLLSVADHENKMRQCVVEEMLNRMNCLAMAHTMEDAREIKQQIRVLELIDVLDYIISSILAGKNPTAVWNKVFANIGNIPTGWFSNHVTVLITTELDEDAYKKLIQIWSSLEDFFKQLLATLQGELNMLVQKFYIGTCEKRKKFELEHQGLSEDEVEQIPFRQVAIEWLEDLAGSCNKDHGTSFLPNLHKAVSLEFSASGIFHDVVDVTMKEGSDRGLDFLKQRLRNSISSWFPRIIK